ncbi:ATP-binding protein [Sansalvadorimonas verongulae]|uniref:ATP-binding protein n=1 Tax=Sansalvadorimonas verongulae TaxID=2172824 RepID=UPI0018AD2B13|nr:ATP-binding protein [Sansalvadorimonas verongulae]
MEFGPDNSRYFSILAAIASGRSSRPEIESLLETSIGPHLEKLENDFDITQRHQPVLAKPNSRLVRYRIADAFLAFWFRFIYSNRSAIEIKNFAFVQKVIERDYPTWSGLWLEELIRQLLADTGHYNTIGSYWERGNQNEIDIVAINDLEKTVLIGEVKRNPANIRISKLKDKAQRLSQQLRQYEITYKGFSLDDIPELLKQKRQ